jgi:hypothetical protein
MSTWSTTDHGPNWSLSNGNLTAAASGSSNTVIRGTLSQNSGKRYFEITPSGLANNFSDVVWRTARRS